MAIATPLQPRKQPVQARSAATLEAIFEATIQVLLSHGHHKLTTTLVAERAGVSVGSLYQYYPNKHALLAATIERHLRHIVEQVEVACQHAAGQPLERAVRLLCDAFVDAKMARVDVSRALYGPSAELDGPAIVKTMTFRAASAVSALAGSLSDARFDNPPMTALFLLTALVGPVQAVLEAGASPELVATLRQNLYALAGGYLHAVARPAL
jgi:AcrR family transcriptional regulator